MKLKVKEFPGWGGNEETKKELDYFLSNLADQIYHIDTYYSIVSGVSTCIYYKEL